LKINIWWNYKAYKNSASFLAHPAYRNGTRYVN